MSNFHTDVKIRGRAEKKFRFRTETVAPAHAKIGHLFGIDGGLWHNETTAYAILEIWLKPSINAQMHLRDKAKLIPHTNSEMNVNAARKFRFITEMKPMSASCLRPMEDFGLAKPPRVETQFRKYGISAGFCL